MNNPIGRRLCWLVVVTELFFLAGMAHAQTYPAVEAYASFAMSHSAYGQDRINAPGVQFSGAYNPLRFLRLVGEFSGQFHGTDVYWDSKKLKLRDYQLLFGPEFVLRNKSRFTPFVHVMAGYARRNFAWPTGQYSCSGYGYSCSENENTIVRDAGAAVAFGGGLDIDVHPMISIRAIQFDYIRAHLNRDHLQLVPDGSLPPLSTSWQKNYRFGVGIVFRIGEKGTKRTR